MTRLAYGSSEHPADTLRRASVLAADVEQDIRAGRYREARRLIAEIFGNMAKAEIRLKELRAMASKGGFR